MNLELKVIADVGLIGFPNVGKSTLLSRVTNAEPKIANYHFTTLNPNLGVVDLDGAKGFVMADIPGLIEGASEGVGLGHEFLRHIERTKLMIHVVDAAGTEGRDPVDDIHKINAELAAYNPEIAERPQVIAANKTDLIYDPEDDPVQRLKDEFEPKGIKVFPISGATGKGISDLLYYVSNELQKLDQKPVVFEQEYFPDDELIYEDLPYTVEQADGMYVVEGPKIEKMLGYTNLDSEKGFAFLQILRELASRKVTQLECTDFSLIIINKENIMTTKQRAYLKGLAMTMDPIFQVGKASMNPGLTEAIAEALEARELIKISVLKNCMDDPREIAETLAERTQSQVVQVIGKKIVLYKEGKDDKKKIQLPK